MEQEQEQGSSQQPRRLVLAPLAALSRYALCIITSFLHGHELLGLRCQSKHCRDAVWFAATLHAGCSSLQLDSRHPLEVRMHVARAFGHACRHVMWRTMFHSYGYLDFGYQGLIAWCSAAPNLIRLHAPDIKDIDMETAAAIGRACPMLEDVRFDFLCDVSPAESWARCFPRLRTHRLGGDF